MAVIALGRGTTRRLLALALAVAATVVVASCDNAGGTYTTAQVTKADGKSLCLDPEDSKQDFLRACFPITPAVAGAVAIGDCVGVLVPFTADDGGQPAIRSVRRLDRACKHHP